MERRKIGSFDSLRHGDKIISPIDNEVTEFYIHSDGEKYLASKNSLFPYFQFDAEDFYIYDGKKETGEVDREYFSCKEKADKQYYRTCTQCGFTYDSRLQGHYHY